MTPRTSRIILDFLIGFVFYYIIVVVTDIWWLPFFIVPYVIWNYYDGATRRDLV